MPEVGAYNREMEIIENLKRIYYFTKRTAKTLAFGSKAEIPTDSAL